MNASNDLDRRLDDLLADGPATAPDRAVAAALDHARRHPRRRDPLRVVRPDPMGPTRAASARRTVTLLVAAALLVAVAITAASVGGLFDRRSVVVPPLPSVSPSASVSASAAPSVAPSVAPSLSASPSPSVSRVDLVDDIGGHAFVEITDLSGTLIATRSGQQSEGIEPTGDIGVTNPTGDPAIVILTWVGCPSDTRHVLTIEPDGRTMTLDQPVCVGDTLGVPRILVLTFSGPVPASEVNATVRRIGG